MDNRGTSVIKRVAVEFLKRSGALANNTNWFTSRGRHIDKTMETFFLCWDVLCKILGFPSPLSLLMMWSFFMSILLKRTVCFFRMVNAIYELWWNTLLQCSFDIIYCTFVKPTFDWFSKNLWYKPVGDRDHEVLGMGSFEKYKLYGKST
jgi:hypothetical protein